MQKCTAKLLLRLVKNSYVSLENDKMVAELLQTIANKKVNPGCVQVRSRMPCTSQEYAGLVLPAAPCC